MAPQTRATRVGILVMCVCASLTTLAAQTVIKPPKNKFKPEQDVELGRQAAAEVRKQYPIIKDEKIASYLKGIGDRLVAAAPAELNNPIYEYSFTPVNLKEINAFALPGGPMFVYRGMFDAAASEAEVAGVMAHELSHVLLRHGTANETKAENPWLQIGQMAGQVGGAVVGGAAGSAIAEGSQFGLGTMLLKYSRAYEKQADLMGAQIMARAGYDPRALAHMFETIQAQAQQGGGGAPAWLSDHPDPGNRTDYITKEAASLTIASAADMSGFAPIKASFSSLPPAKSMGELAKAKQQPQPQEGEPAGPALAVGNPGQPVPPPATQFHDISGGKIFKASVPANWTALAGKSSIKVIPENGYGDMNGQTVFNYGVEFGVTQAASRDLAEATKGWLTAVAQGNPSLKLGGQQQALKISQRSALATPLVNPSALGGNEQIVVYTTFLSDGTLFYYLTVVPEKDAAAFEATFRHIVESIKLTDAR
jgi:Zn-dependent protease with chaperone function